MSTQQETSEIPLSDDELTDALTEAEAALARDYARMLSLVRDAEERRLATRTGFRSTATLLTARLNLSVGEARNRVTLATAGLSLADEALAQGLISAAHLKEIHRVLKKAPDSVSPEDLLEAERLLVELSQQSTPTTTRQAAVHLTVLQGSENDRFDRRHNRPTHRRREFRYWITADGWMKFNGMLDQKSAHLLEGLLLRFIEPFVNGEQAQPDDFTIAGRHGDAIGDIIGVAARTAAQSATSDKPGADIDPLSQGRKAESSGKSFLDRVRRTRMPRQRTSEHQTPSGTSRSGRESRRPHTNAVEQSHSDNKYRDTTA